MENNELTYSEVLLPEGLEIRQDYEIVLSKDLNTSTKEQIVKECKLLNRVFSAIGKVLIYYRHATDVIDDVNMNIVLDNRDKDCWCFDIRMCYTARQSFIRWIVDRDKIRENICLGDINQICVRYGKDYDVVECINTYLDNLVEWCKVHQDEEVHEWLRRFGDVYNRR